MRYARATALLLSGGAVAATLLAAQDQPQPTFRIDATYVRVDAFPSRDGHPVTDLTLDDFEISEDRVPQKIEQFERVVIRPVGAGAGRPEPNTVSDSREAVKESRARVFVLFLDPMHVEQIASRGTSPLLADALSRLIGPDDYVGVMVPPMRFRDVTFARRTVALDSLLRNDWWGKRDATFEDPDEQAYAACYPGNPPRQGVVVPPDQGIAQEMILRRRETQTLDTLEDLVKNIRGLREERKAVLAITDGWLLYRPNANLTRPLDYVTPPTLLPLGVDPNGGRLSTNSPAAGYDSAHRKCEADRQRLANIDSQPRLRDIIDEANRSNVSFYPVDPRGLAAFDDNIVPAAGVGVGPAANPTLTGQEEANRLRTRQQTLRELAEGTDGMAVVGTNRIREGFQRIIDDLSEYYLLGYHSTGRLDGRFHAIAVRVKRPGVTVRARRGYQALRAADLAPSTTGSPAPAGADAAFATAASAAIGAIANNVRDTPLRVYVTSGWRAGATGVPGAAFWAVGEVANRSGAEFDVQLLGPSGDIVTQAKGHVAAGTTGTVVRVDAPPSVSPGEYSVRVTSHTPDSSETMSAPVVLSPSPAASGAVFIRRGPTTGNKEMPTADVRFRRTERLRVEVPSFAEATGARLLDRTGKPMTAVPVAAASRRDQDGTQWISGELQLNPLAPGDYMVEIESGDTRTLAAFRIVP